MADADYYGPPALQAIDPDEFILGAYVGTGDAGSTNQLKRQHNTMVAAAGGPWYWGAMIGDAAEYAEVRIPPMQGVRAVDIAGARPDATTVTVSLTDDTGLLTSQAFSNESTHYVKEFARAIDGYVVIKVLYAAGALADWFSLLVAPYTFTTPVAGMEGDGLLHSDRFATDKPVSTRIMSAMSAQVYATWRRCQVHHVYMDPGGTRYAVGTGFYMAAVPIGGRGRKIEMSVQGAGAAATTVTLSIGPQKVEVTGFPAVQGNFRYAATANVVLDGHYVAYVKVVVPPAGSFKLFGLSIYDKPD